MLILISIFIYFVGLEHLGIMLLEMFGSTHLQHKAFGISESFLKQPEAKISLGNQGIYNGMLAVLIIISTFVFSGDVRQTVLELLMLFVIIVALYGAITVSKKIFFVQCLPALITFLLLVI